MTTERSGRGRIAAVVAVLFAVQAGLTLAAYINHRSLSLSHGVRIYASPQTIAGASAAMRVAVLDARSGRDAAFDAVTIATAPPDVALTEPANMGSAFVVAHVERARAPAYELRVQLEAPPTGTREVFADVTAGTVPDWLADSDTFTGPPSARRPNLTVTGSDEPRVRLRAPSDDRCPWQVAVSANGGVAAVGLDNAIRVRVADAEGGPVSGVVVRLTPPSGASASASASPTDALGVAELSLRPEGTEEWRLTFECQTAEGAPFPVERTIDVVPSWDGVVLQTTQTNYVGSEAVGFTATHQRQWGTWHQDVVCDGAWLATQTTPITGGTGTFAVMELSATARADGPRLCMVQGYTFLLSPDPPRSVSYFLVRPDGMSSGDAVSQLVEAALRHGAVSLREQLGPGTLAALQSAPPAALERFARWLLDSLPQRFVPPPSLEDDLPAAEAAFDAAHRKEGNTFLVALLVDAVVAFLAVFGVLIPGAARQRAAIRRVAEAWEDEDADGTSVLDEGLDDGRRARLTLAIGGLALGASLLGIAILLVFLR